MLSSSSFASSKDKDSTLFFGVSFASSRDKGSKLFSSVSLESSRDNRLSHSSKLLSLFFSVFTSSSSKEIKLKSSSLEASRVSFIFLEVESLFEEFSSSEIIIKSSSSVFFFVILGII